MDYRRAYFVFVFIFMCSILYYVNYTLNSKISDEVQQYHTRYRKPTRIINLVVKIPKNVWEIKDDSCYQTFQPHVSALQDNWQKVGNSSKLLLLSAYEDNRLVRTKYIRIIAMSKGQFTGRVLCRVWFKDTRQTVTEVEIQDLWIKSWDMAKPEEYYRPLLLSCKYKYPNPVAVSVVYEPCQKPKNVFLLSPINSNQAKKNFAVCLKPLNYQQDLTPRLVEWLELQFLLGASVISVYKYHLHSKTLQVLESYVKSGKVVIHEHHLPDLNFKSLDSESLQFRGQQDSKSARSEELQSEGSKVIKTDIEGQNPVHFKKLNFEYFKSTDSDYIESQDSKETNLKDLNSVSPEDSKSKGLKSTEVWQKRRHEMAIYNDCFYRHLNTHRYVANFDLDEAIVPLRHNTWEELLRQAMAEDRRLSKSASLAVQNVYFFDSFPEDETVPRNFHMLRHVYRSANFTPPGFAQKSFFATGLALSVTNHYALKALHPSVRTIGGIGTDLAQLHHYRRDCPPKMEKECEENYMKFWIKDPVLLKFKDKLVKNVFLKMKELNVSISF